MFRKNFQVKSQFAINVFLLIATVILSTHPLLLAEDETQTLENEIELLANNHHNLQSKSISKSPKNNEKSMLQGDYAAGLKLALEPLRRQSPQKLKSDLKEKAQEDALLLKLVEGCPSCIDYFILLIKDDHALYNLTDILKDKTKLKYFLFWMLMTIIFGFILNFFTSGFSNSLFQSLILFIVKLIIVNALRIYIIQLYYAVEIKAFVQLTYKFLLTKFSF